MQLDLVFDIRENRIDKNDVIVAGLSHIAIWFYFSIILTKFFENEFYS